MEAASARCIIADDMAVAEKSVFISDKTFQTYRSPGVDFTRTDSHLCAESVTESVGKPRGTVAVDARGIYQLHEMLGGFRVFRNDAVRVM